MEKYLAGAFGLLIGLVGLWTSLVQWRNLRALNRWKMTSGKIIERGTFLVETANTGAPAYQYSPLVNYVYQVDGEEFANNSIFPRHIQAPERGTRDWAEKRSTLFTDPVKVFYNPENPAESFLVKTSQTKLYVMGAASVFVTIFTLIFFVLL